MVVLGLPSLHGPPILQAGTAVPTQLQFTSKMSLVVLGLPSLHGPPILQAGPTGTQLQFTSKIPFDTVGVLQDEPIVQAGVVVLSHISPIPSPSASSWPGLKMNTQLSVKSKIPSLSKSKPTKSPAQVQVSSNLSATVKGSPSSQALHGTQSIVVSQASPIPLLLESNCAGLNTVGQLSALSGIPSLSISVITGVPLH